MRVSIAGSPLGKQLFFINSENLSAYESSKTVPLEQKYRGNLRASFYAQKFKQQQKRPQSHNANAHKMMRNQSQKEPIQQTTNMAILVPFYANTKQNTRKASKNPILGFGQAAAVQNSSEKHFLHKSDLVRKQRGARHYSNTKRDTVYQNIVNDMNEYFSMMKLSTYKRNFKKNPKNAQSDQRKQEVESAVVRERYYAWPEGHLNVRGLKPSTTQEVIMKKNKASKERLDAKLITQEVTSNLEENTKALIKYRSNFLNSCDKQAPQNFLEQAKTEKLSASPVRNLKKNKKNNEAMMEYMGKIKEGMTSDEVQKIRVLYYSDIIWKVWFNASCRFKFEPVGNNFEFPRYFVGRGNNSKLIKIIMSKRWWWKPEVKDENAANFLWTQLKIYSVYQSQSQHARVQHFVTAGDDKINQQKQTDPQKNAGDGNALNWRQYLNSEQNSNQQQNEVQASQDIGQERIVEKQMVEKWQENKLKTGDKNVYLLTQSKYEKWASYLQNNMKKQAKNTENLESRKMLSKQMQLLPSPQKITNHLQYSRMIGNKKALFKTMTLYYELSQQKSAFLPLTYHVIGGLEDKQYLKFLSEYYRRVKQQNNSIWIVKPGEMSNRGCGIKVCKDLQDIKEAIRNKKSHSNGKSFSYIIQEYIRKPFLYQGRKFDIRHYMMVTSTQGCIRGYFYQQGYIRTTSYKYSNNNQNSSVHLTNDAVQKKCRDYGKFEKGNKISYDEFEKYLKERPDFKNNGLSFYKDIHPKIRQICKDILNASYYVIDPKRKGNNFEIFGLDIMIDHNFKPWLIEANTNPCLELSSPILAKLIPKMLDNAFTIAVDPLFPPPSDISLTSKRMNLPDNSLADNKFELILDETVDGKYLNSLYDELNLEQLEGFGSDQQAFESAEDDYDVDY